jgi:hypothetical protein
MSLFRSLIAATMIALCALPAQTGAADKAPKARFVEIENIASFSGFFNLGQGTVRILAILSPSSESSLSAYQEIQRIMEETSNNRLRAFIVYVPVSDQDSRARALDLAAQFPDRRVAHVWDPQKAIAAALPGPSEPASENPLACYLFDTNAAVKDGFSQPALSSPIAADGTSFDATALETEARDLLARFAAKHPNTSRRRAGDGQ